MKKIIIFLLFTSFSYSQDFQDLKNFDTIFVLYKGKKHESKTERKINDTLTTRTFVFYTKVGNRKSKVISFLYPRACNDMTKNAYERFITKKYVKKVKKKSVDFNYFLKTKNILEESFNYDIVTVYYVIDLTTKSSKGEYVIYRVSPILFNRRPQLL